MPLELITVFDEIETLVHKRVNIYNAKVMKSADYDEALTINEVGRYGMLIDAYNDVASIIMTTKGCWCCPGFPYAIPDYKQLLKEAMKRVEADIEERVSLGGSKGSDGSRTPKVREEGSAPPSADNV